MKDRYLSMQFLHGNVAETQAGAVGQFIGNRLQRHVDGAVQVEQGAGCGKRVQGRKG